MNNKKEKNWNGKDYVVALGEIRHVFGFRHVLYLWGGGSRRFLGLGWFGVGWGDGYRFLAIKSKTKPTSKDVESGELDSLSLEKRVKVLEDKLAKIIEVLK